MKVKVFIFIILCLCQVIPAFGQKSSKKVTITGKVVDAENNPLSGVVILIDNENSDCVTDNEGIYKLKVSSKAKIVTAFSMMNGMKEVPMEGKTVINFTLYKKGLEPMVEDKKVKEETVDVGYGNTKKDDLTNSVRRIDGQNPKYESYTNIYDMIQREVPGVRVSGKTIYLVEPSSISMNIEPLILVDGVSVESVDFIEPKLVKSISILKGSSATIYGSRGANGVILITLLKGNEKK